jgi:hypothetical protein
MGKATTGSMFQEAPRKILAGYRYASQPARNPKDRWTETPKNC